jgi:flagellar protein FlgJ
MGDGLLDSQAGDAWRDMYDQQLSIVLSQGGRGLGIARMLERQLGGHATDAAAPSLPAGAHAEPSPPAGGDGQPLLDAVADATRAAGRQALRWLPADAGDFVRELAPYAKRAARRLGVSMRALLAQAALETNWGQHMPVRADGRSSNNLFGIKAGGGWDGDSVGVPTVEFEDGVAVRRHAQFRAYDSPAQAFADYAELIGGSPRYAQVRGRGDDVRGFARALVRGGYATDPAYAEKIAAVADSDTMSRALAALKNTAGVPTE